MEYSKQDKFIKGLAERYDERRRADNLREEEDGKFVAETQGGKLLIGFIVNGVMNCW
jgi:hypothetical protein